MKNYLNNLYNGDDLKIPSFLASDNHCIECYPYNCTNSSKKMEWSYFNGRNTFKGLKFSLSSSYTKIKTSYPIVSNTSNIIGKLKINGNIIIPSNRINIIIGPRSSGKSLLLEHILNLVNGENYNKIYKNFVKEIKKDIYSYDKKVMLSQSQKRVLYFKQSHFIDKAIDNQTVLLSGLPDSKKYENLDKIMKPTFDFYLKLDDYFSSIQKILSRNISPFENINLFFEVNNSDWRFNFQDNLYDCIDIEQEIDLINSYASFLETRKKELDLIRLNINSFNDSIKFSKKDLYERNFLNKIRKIDFKLEILDSNIEEIKKIQKELELFCRKLQILANVQKDLKTNLNKLKSDSQREKTNFINKHKNICKEFKALGNIVQSLNTFSNLVFQVVYLDKDKPYAKANYMIQYDTEHSLQKENIIESLKEVIYKKYLQDIKDTNFNYNTINILKTISNLRKTLVNNNFNNEQTIFKSSFNRKTMTYETFREKVFDSKVIPNITQNGNSIMENSPGLRAQILFELNLDREQIKDYSIILLDQPEDSIDNTFVSHDMIRIIKDLANEKQIFLVTHNANLVVNLDPDNIIIPFNQNGQITYHYGRLEDNITVDGNEVSIIDLIAKYIEGGRYSLIKRIENYELGEIKNVR